MNKYSNIILVYLILVYLILVYLIYIYKEKKVYSIKKKDLINNRML